MRNTCDYGDCDFKINLRPVQREAQGPWAFLCPAHKSMFDGCTSMAHPRIIAMIRWSVAADKNRPEQPNNQEATPMSRIRIESREAGLREIAELRRRLDAVADAVEALMRFPEEDPYEDGAVLRFDKTFPSHPIDVYSYVFLKCGNLWYSSGPRRPGPISWASLALFMSEGVVGPIWHVATYDEAFPAVED